ncbi:MAG TPA: hypothetical protein VMA13_10180 [Candidatus Saccharimonadales bacterium]|nr:hypothetical protein [Candidatus Saccharimonadales bacterium]
MASKRSDEKDRPGFWEMVGLFILRVTDSGLAPWVLVALFILGLVWIATRNLDSKDTASLIASFMGIRGIAWSGWVVAFIQIPVFKWSLNKARRLRINQLNDLQEENEKARELLKKQKQSELELEH